jgi:hypothetical protein
LLVSPSAECRGEARVERISELLFEASDETLKSDPTALKQPGTRALNMDEAAA